LIHCQDQIEPVEINGFDAACALSGNVDAVAGGRGDRAAIRPFALMPTAGTSRIDFERRAAAGLSRKMPENAFGKR